MPRGGDADEFPIKNFLGLNLLGSADMVRDNEWTKLQNFYQPTKGVLAPRFGTTGIANGTSLPLANRVSGVWRHYTPYGDRISLYHCEPSTALLPDNTSDLVLTKIADTLGNINNGTVGAFDLMVCYSWIGAGVEQTYNTKNRSGFNSLSFPLNASSNTSHQKITLNQHDSLQVTVPAFPSGVRGANIFAARATGTTTQMTYMGTVTASGGGLTIREFIGDTTCYRDTYSSTPTAVGTNVNGGTLKPGTYYVGMAWVVDPGAQEGAASPNPQNTWMNQFDVSRLGGIVVTVLPGQNAIAVTTPNNVSVVTGGSAGGAQALYIFIGTQPLNVHAATCVGVQRYNRTTNYVSIPATNAQSTPQLSATQYTTPDLTTTPLFYGNVNDSYTGGPNHVTPHTGVVQNSRHAFILADPAGGSVYEIFPSRSQFFYLYGLTDNAFNGGAGGGGVLNGKYLCWFEAPKSANDTYRGSFDSAYTQPYAYNKTIGDPQFSYALGMTYFANGGDILWETDGFTLGQVGRVATDSSHYTALPPVPRFVLSFQGSLVTAGADQKNLIYASNANAPNNWATGGSGSLLRFVPVGDAEGPGVLALGIFTPGTESTNNPNSYIVGFKKHGCWMTSGITDPSTSSIPLGNLLGQAPLPMLQTSGRIGCTAYRTIVSTPLGLVFLGSDGNIYLINSIAEPRRIGTKIQPALAHLPANDTWMGLCTASYHDNHYKLSYPSADAVALNPVTCDSELWLDTRTDVSPMTWVGPHAGIKVANQTVFSGEGDDLSRVGVNVATGGVIKLDDITVRQDLGVDIVQKALSKIYRFGAETHLKRVLGAFIDCYLDDSFTNNLLFEGFADADYQQVNRLLSSGGGVWDVSLFDQSNFADAAWQGFSFMFGGTNLNGRAFQFQITKSDAAPFVLASVTLLLQTERRRIVA